MKAFWNSAGIIRKLTPDSKTSPGYGWNKLVHFDQKGAHTLRFRLPDPELRSAEPGQPVDMDVPAIEGGVAHLKIKDRDAAVSCAGDSREEAIEGLYLAGTPVADPYLKKLLAGNR